MVEHCSPTLAGLKCGSLFRYAYTENLESQTETVNTALGCKGVHVLPLGETDGGAIVYVYRPSMLEELISEKNTNDFLQRLGYGSITVDGTLRELGRKIETYGTLPHEIGLFLGYPLADVRGFMENCGKNSLCVGCWKVYGDEDAAVKAFEKYRKCRKVFTRRFREGTPLTRLAVQCTSSA